LHTVISCRIYSALAATVNSRKILMSSEREESYFSGPNQSIQTLLVQVR